MIDHRADDLAHLGNGHRPRQRQYDEAVWVFDHRPKHFVGFAHSAAPKGCLAHSGQQAVEGPNLFRVERLKRFEAILRPIVKFTCTHMKSLPTIEVCGETAHSLYTTNDRGVNEVTPRETPRSILLREHA